MDITSAKNIAFGIFTFAPAPLLACIVCVLLFFLSLLNGRKYSAKAVFKFCIRTAIYQAIFLVGTVGLFGILWAMEQIGFIPLVLLLPLSTVFSLFVFTKICWSGRNEIGT